MVSQKYTTFILANIDDSAHWDTDKGNVEGTSVEQNGSTTMCFAPGYVTKITSYNQRSEYFCKFVKVLLTNLEMEKPSLYHHAFNIILGGNSTNAIRFNLYKLVGKESWRKIAADYVDLLEKEFKANGHSEMKAEAVARKIVRCTSFAPEFETFEKYSSKKEVKAVTRVRFTSLPPLYCKNDKKDSDLKD